jgi:hypothetical protein
MVDLVRWCIERYSTPSRMIERRDHDSDDNAHADQTRYELVGGAKDGERPRSPARARRPRVAIGRAIVYPASRV